MDIILALTLVVLAGSYVGYSYYKKFTGRQSPKSDCTCSCSQSGCDASRRCGQPSGNPPR